MRPRTLGEYAGQQHLIAPGTALHKAISAGKVFSLILWGPPGTGKTTLAELKTRIAQTLDYLNSFKAEDFAEAADRHISQPRWEGKYLTGFEFAVQHAIPNIYFHISTAYAILRHNGVDVGKKDYLGPMPYKN